MLGSCSSGFSGSTVVPGSSGVSGSVGSPGPTLGSCSSGFSGSVVVPGSSGVSGLVVVPGFSGVSIFAESPPLSAFSSSLKSSVCSSWGMVVSGSGRKNSHALKIAKLQITAKITASMRIFFISLPYPLYFCNFYYFILYALAYNVVNKLELFFLIFLRKI